jgi:hypothetical protein
MASRLAVGAAAGGLLRGLRREPAYRVPITSADGMVDEPWQIR